MRIASAACPPACAAGRVLEASFKPLRQRQQEFAARRAHAHVARRPCMLGHKVEACQTAAERAVPSHATFPPQRYTVAVFQAQRPLVVRSAAGVLTQTSVGKGCSPDARKGGERSVRREEPARHKVVLRQWFKMPADATTAK